MIDLLLLSLSIFIIYLSYTLFSIKMMPISLSDTYYQLEKVGKPKWLFQLCMFLASALLLPCWLVISPENIQFLAFLGCGGLLFVSVAPAFKLPLEGLFIMFLHTLVVVVQYYGFYGWVYGIFLCLY